MLSAGRSASYDQPVSLDAAAAPAPAPYSVGDAIGYGWKKFEANAARMLGYGVLLMIPFALAYGAEFAGQIALSVKRQQDRENGVDTTFNNVHVAPWIFIVVAVVYLAFLLYSLVVHVGIVRATTRVLDGEAWSLGTFFSFDRVGAVFVTGLLTTLGGLLGLVLCILPGIAFWFLTQYAVWFVVDKRQSPVTAIKSSIALVRANLGNAILFFLLYFAITMAGECLCFVGLLVAIPVTYIGTGYTYRKFQNEPVAA